MGGSGCTRHANMCILRCVMRDWPPPPPPPPPPFDAPALDGAVLAGAAPVQRARRWPLVVLSGLLVLVVLIAAAGGSARSTSDATAAAAQLAHQKQYGTAVAMYRAIATRTGPLFLFDRSDVSGAELNAQRTTLAWATTLQQQGHVDQAVALTRSVGDPTLASNVRDEQAALLVAAARDAAARGDYQTALSRLSQVTNSSLSATAAAAPVPQLQTDYLIARARALLAAGDGVHAVTALDDARQRGPSGAAAAAPLLPQALLVAATQENGAASYAEAVVTLQRVINDYGGTGEAKQARSLLAANQPVSGTLVDHSGAPISGQVRLSSHFFSEPGGYVTSGPFYVADADSQGNFRFESIPVGGPYVFEAFHNGGWVTLVDRNTGQPANPVNVVALTPVDLAFITLS